MVVQEVFWSVGYKMAEKRMKTKPLKNLGELEEKRNGPAVKGKVLPCIIPFVPAINVGHTDKEVLCNNVPSLRAAIIEPNRAVGVCSEWSVPTKNIVISNGKKC